MNSDRRLTRSRRSRVIAGVCGGLSEYSGIDTTLIRILFVIIALAGGGGLLIYLALWLILPRGY